MFKKIFLFILCLAPWFLNLLFKIDYSYYDLIKLPVFAPPQKFYMIAWSIVYIGIAISIYKIVFDYKLKDIPNSYKIVLLINYLLNQSYTLVFFNLKSNFLGFVICLLIFITTIVLYKETKNLKESSSKFLGPYLLLSLFGTILSLSIYLINFF